MQIKQNIFMLWIMTFYKHDTNSLQLIETWWNNKLGKKCILLKSKYFDKYGIYINGIR